MGGVSKTNGRKGAMARLRMAAVPALPAVAVILAAAIGAAGTPSSLPQRPAKVAVAEAGVQCTCHIDPATCPAHRGRLSGPVTTSLVRETGIVSPFSSLPRITIRSPTQPCAS